MTQKGMPRLAVWLMGAAKCITAVFLLLILLQSMCNTVYTDYWQHNFFLPDNPIWHILILVAAGAAAVLLWKKRNRAEAWLNRHTWVLPCAAALYAVLLIWWVTTSLCVSQEETDSTILMHIAQQFRAHDFQAYAQGAYLYRNPHQAGMVMILYGLSFLFGPSNYLALELVNAGGALLTVCTLARMAERLTAKKSAAFAVLLAACAFYPILFYTSFVYGLLWGLALSVQAFYWQLRWMQTGCWRDASAAGVFIGCACIVKENCKVMLLAMLVIFVLHALHKKSAKPLAALGIVLVLFAGISCGKRAVLLHITDGTSEGISGNPSMAYVAMGLQEGPMAPGWFNGYVNRCLPDSGYDAEAASRQVTEDITARLGEFAADPAMAADFFSRKIASEWCSADFGGMWIVWVRPSSLDTPSWLYTRITDPTRLAYMALAQYMNFFETLVYAGALLAVLLSGHRITEENGALLIAFLGGAVCHTFWEGDCQYLFPYFVLLIPYALSGYALLAQCVTQHRLPDGAGRRTAICKYAAAAALCIALLLPPLFSAVTNVAEPDGTTRYRNEIAEEKQSGLWDMAKDAE